MNDFFNWKTFGESKLSSLVKQSRMEIIQYFGVFGEMQEIWSEVFHVNLLSINIKWFRSEEMMHFLLSCYRTQKR